MRHRRLGSRSWRRCGCFLDRVWSRTLNRWCFWHRRRSDDRHLRSPNRSWLLRRRLNWQVLHRWRSRLCRLLRRLRPLHRRLRQGQCWQFRPGWSRWRRFLNWRSLLWCLLLRRWAGLRLAHCRWHTRRAEWYCVGGGKWYGDHCRQPTHKERSTPQDAPSHGPPTVF